MKYILFSLLLTNCAANLSELDDTDLVMYFYQKDCNGPDLNGPTNEEFYKSLDCALGKVEEYCYKNKPEQTRRICLKLMGIL